MATVSVRYIVDDVDAAIAFYCQHLGFEEQMHPAPAFAMLTRGDLLGGIRRRPLGHVLHQSQRPLRRPPPWGSGGEPARGRAALRGRVVLPLIERDPVDLGVHRHEPRARARRAGADRRRRPTGPARPRAPVGRAGGNGIRGRGVLGGGRAAERRRCPLGPTSARLRTSRRAAPRKPPCTILRWRACSGAAG